MPSAAASITINPQAYAKVVLHAAKYPASTVRGLLVGRRSSESSSHSFEVVDAIPLVHSWTDLAPATELGCALAQAHLSSANAGGASAGAQIIGLYEAPAVMGDRELSRAGTKLARKIASIGGSSSPAGAIVLLVNNSLLLSPSSGHALLPFLLSAQENLANAEAQSLPSSSTVLSDEAATIAAVSTAVQNGLAEKLYDFDDHLTDTRQDWLSNSVPLVI
ncbi:unnamed protein product [Tilletia controversa]|uniref:MPN domain-containing protein n=4 Tax=Tilletia TaxID=13289 RepID=A0A8X7MQJ2_9BASI|nr:hypothetical protein CF336_g5689 [Tilletia laevis]KAE8193725.1 hypothetical protein CF328_g4963 [Tilletia controversa]KAE8256842.1 hypothetical protein A4X03_0g5001 [Tilletia caries]KAE8243879.1 hypothetical protein A4X06_0g6071 [Tilletia controversa]CAD6890853.1 unnamed protein product [Tilletia caries]